MYVNDLALQIKASSLGIKVDLLYLLYASDIVLFGECEKDLQIMFNIFAEWCWKRRHE